MNNDMTTQTQIALDLLERFPQASSLTLARTAYRDNQSAFASLESARSVFRRLRGATGEGNRKSSSHKGFFRPAQAPGDPFGTIPKGVTYFDEWRALQVDGPLRVLVMSDIHIPYHDREAVLTALRWGKQNGVNALLLNGDIADFFSVSFWEKDPRKRDFPGELKACKEFLTAVRAGFPRAKIIAKIGNHEERWVRYMTVKAPELLGVPEFEIAEMLRLEELRIESVGEKRPVRLGQLNVLHGHEYRFAISNPVNPARGLFLRCKAFALCGHFHQGSYHSDRTVEQKTVACWSTGCLCDLHPDYAPGSSR